MNIALMVIPEISGQESGRLLSHPGQVFSFGSKSRFIEEKNNGLVFSFIILTSFTGFGAGEIPLTFILIAVIFIGQQIYEGAILRDNVSQFSHIIGGIVGAVIGYNWNRKR